MPRISFFDKKPESWPTLVLIIFIFFCHQLVYNDLEFFIQFLFNIFVLRFYISLVSLIYVKLSFITINWRLAKKIIKWVETNNCLYKWFKCSYIRLFMSLIAMFYLSLYKKSFRSWLSTSLIIKKEVYSLMFLTLNFEFTYPC